MTPLRRFPFPAMAVILAATLLAPPACQSQDKSRPSSPIAAPPDAIPGPRPVAPPGRPQMRVHDFSMNASGIKLERTTVAPGRVKGQPFSMAARRLEFEVFDAKGAKIYTGTLDHPLWQEAEVPNPKARGGWQRISRPRPNWVFHIRLPAEAVGLRIAFFEVITTAGKPETRRAVGVVPLPAPGQVKRP